MKTIKVNNDSSQKQTMILDDQSTFTYELEYLPNQFGWFIKTLTYKGFTINSIRIVTSLNFLNQFSNQIPFGLGCLTNDASEPLLQDDFSSGKATLYLLNSAECAEYQRILNGQVSA